MNAKEFIRKFGWEVSTRLQQEMKGITEQVADCVAGWGQSEWDNLKQYIDAYELVQSYGGMSVINHKDFRLSMIISKPNKAKELNKAITLIKEI